MTTTAQRPHWVSRIGGSGRGAQHLVISVMVTDVVCLTLTACDKSAAHASPGDGVFKGVVTCKNCIKYLETR